MLCKLLLEQVGEFAFNGSQFQFREKKVLEMDGGNGSTTVRMYLMLLDVHLKMIKIVGFVIFYHNKKIRFLTQFFSQG